MNLFQEKLKKADGIVSVFSAVLLGASVALFLLCLEYLGIKMTVLRWLPVPVYAFMLWSLLRGAYFKDAAYLCGFVFLLWYLLSRFLLGDTGLRLSVYTLGEMCTVYGFGFLFAAVSRDGNRRRFLNVLLSVLVLVFAVYAVVGVVASLWRVDITLPGGVHETYMDEWTGRLYILEMNPNSCAPFSCFGLVFTVYLLLEYKRRWLLLPGLILIVLFYWVLALTNSLGARIGLTIASAPMAAILFFRFVPIKKKWVFVPVMLAGLLLTWYGFLLTGSLLDGVSDRLLREKTIRQLRQVEEVGSGEELDTAVEEYMEDYYYADLVSERESLLDNADMSGRTSFYVTVLEWLREHPKNLWLGCIESRITILLGNTVDDLRFYGYLHSSFIQALCVVGTPGLLIVLCLCVLLVVYSLKIIFSDKSEAAEKMLPVMCVPVAVQGLIESFLFVTSSSLIFSSVFNLLFFILAGYIVETQRKLKAEKSSV